MTAWATVFEWVLGMTLWTGLLFAAARLADRLLAGRVAARARMLLYAAVAARLLLPVRWSGGWAVVDVAGAVPVLGDAAPPTLPFVVWQAVAPVTSPFPWMTWLGVAVYAAVVAGFALHRWNATRRPATLRPVRPSLGDIVPPGVVAFETDDVGPAVVGVLRPRILLPSRLVESLDAASLRWVVRHEAAHIAARDPLVLAAAQTVVVALWPVVPLWLALRRVRALMEVACDERVLAGSPEVERRSYMRTLLDVVNRRTCAVSPIASLGFGSGLSERLRALGATARRWPRFAQGAAVAGAVTALVACSSSSLSAPSEAADYLIVSLVRLPGEATVTGADGTERPVGAYLVGARLLARCPDAPLTVRASGDIHVSDGLIRLGGDKVSVESGTSSPRWLRLSGDVDASPADRIVGSPMLLACDGQESSMSIGSGSGDGRSGSYRIAFSVTPAGDGLLDLGLTFEQKLDGTTVRELGASTFRIREGDTCLIATRRPEGAPR